MNEMLTRQQIKKNARDALHACQGPAIGVYLIAALVLAFVSSVTVGIGAFLVVPVVTVTLKGFYHRMYKHGTDKIEHTVQRLWDRYLTKTGGYLWMGLLTFLWSLLFFVPGIVMGIGYSMTPYILDDCPHVRAMDAVKISYKITRGYKVDLFVAALSFLGWELLSVCTFGILEILFTGPYRELTFGGIYQELKKEALANGTLTLEELTGEY